MAESAPPSSPRDRLPPVYRRRLVLAVLAWMVLLIGFAAWLIHAAPDTARRVDALIPQARAPLQTVYITPQITASAPAAEDTAPPSPSALTSKKTSLVLIMADLGLQSTLVTRAVAELPPEVILAFHPYERLQENLKIARDGQHETLVQLPMEPVDYPKNDPGPRALMSRATEAQNATILAGILSESRGATGVLNSMGGQFLQDPQKLQPILQTLQKAGALFVENPQNPDSRARAIAQSLKLPYLAVNLVIDTQATETYINRQLGALESIAQSQGVAIGLITPYPLSFTLVKSWIKTLNDRGFELVSLSSVLKKNKGPTP